MDPQILLARHKVFLVGTTNHPESIDPHILRGEGSRRRLRSNLLAPSKERNR
jgi:SpoVK/Ycf46/Vps4 family AAA+-type ATPase